VGDACLDELPPVRHKALPRIKTNGMGLRVELQRSHAALMRLRDQKLQHGTPCALSAPLAQHRHAADMSVGKQSAGADRQTFAVQGERVQRHSIVCIPFHVLRNTLLDNKHRPPQRLQHNPVIRPGRSADREFP